MSDTRAHVENAPTQAGGAERTPRLRADARRNLDRIVDAARDVFVEQGPDAPLEEIAQRAGVGIATLYRRFPSRQALARGVALDVWRRMAHEAERALAEEDDAFLALAHYMHRALDLRIGAVMPLLASQVLMDEEARGARERSVEPVRAMVTAAQAAGTLRSDVTYADTGLLLIRLNRPLSAAFPRALDDALAHRHLDLLIDGLRAAHSHPLPGPALSLEDLRGMSPEATPVSPDDEKSRPPDDRENGQASV